jgi:hypothetical protein
MSIRVIVLALSALSANMVLADGSSIGKIYYPYVQSLEKEFEYEALVERDNVERGKHQVNHRFGLGFSVSEDWFAEASVNYHDANSFALESYELELLHQLTEQGEYDSDWGLLLELEKEDTEDLWESSLGILNSFEWHRWQMTTNAFLIYEWGNDIDNEFETALALQAKYRYSALWEPGFELFVSQNTHALGPSIYGMTKVSPSNTLFWELSLLAGVENDTPNTTLKLALEYEFF